MYEDWPETTKVLSAQLRNLRGGVPDVMKAFSGIAQTALAPKALDSKTKELIALGIGVAIRCDDCIAFHIKAQWSEAPRPRKLARRWAWQSTWALVRP
jgi:AhpD family alkylhydroperoxidase